MSGVPFRRSDDFSLNDFDVSLQYDLGLLGLLDAQLFRSIPMYDNWSVVCSVLALPGQQIAHFPLSVVMVAAAHVAQEAKQTYLILLVIFGAIQNISSDREHASVKLGSGNDFDQIRIPTLNAPVSISENKPSTNHQNSYSPNCLTAFLLPVDDEKE